MLRTRRYNMVTRREIPDPNATIDLNRTIDSNRTVHLVNPDGTLTLIQEGVQNKDVVYGHRSGLSVAALNTGNLAKDSLDSSSTSSNGSPTTRTQQKSTEENNPEQSNMMLYIGIGVAAFLIMFLILKKK